jgi:hypothetical protein
MGIGFEQECHERDQLFERLEVRRVTRLDVFDPADDSSSPHLSVGAKVDEKSPADETVLIGRMRHVVVRSIHAATRML